MNLAYCIGKRTDTVLQDPPENSGLQSKDVVIQAEVKGKGDPLGNNLSLSSNSFFWHDWAKAKFYCSDLETLGTLPVTFW